MRSMAAHAAAALLAATLLAGCGEDPQGPGTEGNGVFVIDVAGERFRVKFADRATAAHARRILKGQDEQKVVTGMLKAGDGGFNRGWSWHLDPEAVGFADFTIELCDGRPSFVEAELDYWLNTVKQYCPWSARVVLEEAGD